MSKWKLARIIGLILGVIFLFCWVVHLGPDKIFRFVLEVKWWFIAVLANSFIWYLFYTAAWRSYFSNLVHRIPFLHLFRIKVCGEAVNLMTPIGFIAGDPVRFLLLEKQLGPSTRLGSVIVDRILHSLATVTFVLTGLFIVSVQTTTLSSAVRWGLFGIYFLLVSFLAFIVLELVKGNGLKLFHPLLMKLGLAKRFPKLEENLSDLNSELSGFAGGSLVPFVKAFLFHFAGRILGAIEIAIIFLYLSGSPHFVSSVILASLTSVIHFIFSFIPGGLGIVESLYGGFFYLHGLDVAAGVSMQLIRRLRALFWIVVGLIVLNLRRKKSGASNS